jgi:hypothetical protein
MLKKAASVKSRNRSRRALAMAESLEPRQLLSAKPVATYSQRVMFYNDIQASVSGGTGTSPNQFLVIKNEGSSTLIFTHTGLRIIGDDASQFSFTGKKAPAHIPPGSTRTIPIAFNATAIGVQTAQILAHSNDPKHHVFHIQLRGLGTAGIGGTAEPSLQRIFDLFGFPDQVGETNPASNAFPLTPATPNDGVNLETMTKAGDGDVAIVPLAVFDNQTSPATQVGYYPAGHPELATQLFSVPSSGDSQSVHPLISGTETFDPGTSTFGIYTVFPEFNYRKAVSEDALNTWESNSARQKKVRFYPLINSDGTVVPNSYIFATEDYNVTFDQNDVVGIITNVKPATTPALLTIVNEDGAPSPDRYVFNRIQNLDTTRPNVVHDTDTMRLINSGDDTLTIGSIKLSDGVHWKIVSGGGTNIKIPGGSFRDVKIQFIAAPTSGTVATFNGAVTITSDDPTNLTRTETLAGLWQVNSEQTPSHVYSEPSISQIINTIFGYTTTILKPGEKTDHGGHPVAVGDEVLSAYWQNVDPNTAVDVRLLSAFHRQDNFDEAGNPTSAATTVSWFYKGKSTSPSKLFTQDINEGQSLLPHNTNSTTKPAENTFRPNGTTAFGFDLDNHFSDDTLNALDFDPKDPNMTPIAGTGHSLRFFPLKDSNGNLVPNTYLVAMDYTSNIFANYDYNDNLLLVTNIRPVSMNSTSSLTSAAPHSSFSTAPVIAPTQSDPTNILDSKTDPMVL